MYEETTLSGLRTWIQRYGADAFVARAIVLPTAEHFPDKLEQGAVGLRQMTRRWMAHGGLESYTVALERDPDCAEGEIQFDELVEGCAFFRFSTVALDAASGALTYEVPRAYAARAALSGEGDPYRTNPSNHDPGLLDVEAAYGAVYLGLGALALHGSHVYRQGGHIEGNWHYSYWEHQKVGVLSMDALSDALAAQLVVRGDESAVKAVLAQLAPNQTSSLKKALKRWRGRDAELIERLGLPPKDLWPAPEEVSVPAVALDDEDRRLAAEDARDDASRQRIVYRAPRKPPYMMLGLLTLIALGIALYFLLERSLVAAWLIGLVVIVWLWEFRRPRFVCTMPGCGTSMGANDVTCPGCKNPVKGGVPSIRDALDLPLYE